MKPIKIGIVAESTGLGLRQALTQAARMGSAGIQFDAVGETAPDLLGETGRREFRNLLRSFNQELAAINIPLRRGLDSSENLQPRIEYLQKALQLAFDLGARRVVVPCPKIPEDAAAPRAQVLRESLTAIGKHGDRIGSVLAMEIGYDSAETVRKYLAGYDTGSLKVTYDPANLLLHGHDPIANLAPLKDYLAHVHARDARSVSLSRGMHEVPLGAGDVDWMTFTATLQVLEFNGFMLVEREPGDNQLADVTSGVKFLRRFTSPLV